LRALGEALLEVLRAEAAALAGDFRRSGRSLGIGLALLGAAAGVGFWLFGVLVFTLIAVLAIWLPVWGAALLTALVFATAAGLLAWRGVTRLRRLESPVASVKRRVEDHLDWWQSRLLAETSPPDGAALGGGAAELGPSRGPAPPVKRPVAPDAPEDIPEPEEPDDGDMP
jgi:Putative Actinobacterial Holin-X, holin superfamily III